MHSTISLPSMSGKIERRGMESCPTRRSSELSGSCMVQPLYTTSLSLGTSSSLPTLVVPAETHRIVVSSLYCFRASGEMARSLHWVMETGMSRAWLTTLWMMVGSSMGVVYGFVVAGVVRTGGDGGV
jgi:hypothetical protein